jgi:molybdopterin molybdotransferase
MIDVNQALEIILNSAEILEAKKIKLINSLGHVLAEKIVAKENIPPFNNSAMDGFAILSADTSKASQSQPVKLEIIDYQPAGKVSSKKIVPGKAIKIMTGAIIPKGADAVVKVEDTRSFGSQVEIFKPIKKDTNIRMAGEDIAAGSLVFSVGKEISPVDIGLLASLGFNQVKVIARPKVAIIGTGDELIPVDQPLKPGKIRDSNSYVLYNQAILIGASPSRLGTVLDEMPRVKEALRAALKNNDVVVTTGGVSVGEHDFVKQVFEDLGAELKFWKVAQKPGKPMAFWTMGRKLAFGLPGNPVAAAICFEEYVRPALLKMMGRTKLFRPLVTAKLTHQLKKKPGRLQYIGVRLEVKNGCRFATVNGKHGSGILSSLSGADGIGLLDSQTSLFNQGDEIKVQLFKLPEDH